MPMNRKDYPDNWEQIVAEVLARSGGRCECEGECGLHQGRRCIEENGVVGRYTKGPIVLTSAHLWQGPCAECHAQGIKCGELSHLKSMCQRCHLRYDIEHHKANSARTRDRKRGQMRFEEVQP